MQKISVIIPTRNAEAYMDKLLYSLENQSREVLEIIVIDSQSTDKTKSICKKYNKVRFLEIKKEEFNHGGTRNKAAKMAKGDILVFMTQDAMPKDNYFIDKLVENLGKDEIVASYGKQEANIQSDEIEKFIRSFNYGDKDIIKTKSDINKLGVKTFFFTNVCSAFLKEEFWNVNGFPEKTIMNEDMIIASKIIFNNKKIIYTSKAKVIHSHKYSYIQQFKRNFDVGVVFTDSAEYFYGVKSESEGIKMVKKAINHLIKIKKPYLIPHLIIDSGFKFIGYKMGQNYKKIPIRLVKKMSMHSFYFDQK